ncbi:hypothetical protein ACT47M_002453 [Cronobacter muytjensii]
MSDEKLITADNIRDQIPYYLTQDQREGLVNALKDFPENTNYYLEKYPSELKEAALQGDVFANLKINTPEGPMLKRGLILSNSCDIDCNNDRDYPVRALFAPLVRMESFSTYLKGLGKDRQSINSKIDAIKKQSITNIVYLPASSYFEESLIFLDDIHQVFTDELQELLVAKNKLITLSQVGFYILLFKLSLHFCRFHEKVARYDN